MAAQQKLSLRRIAPPSAVASGKLTECKFWRRNKPRVSEESSRRQHSVQQHVGFLFLVVQVRSSLLNDILQTVGVLLQFVQHAVHYVELSSDANVKPLLNISQAYS